MITPTNTLDALRAVKCKKCKIVSEEGAKRVPQQEYVVNTQISFFCNLNFLLDSLSMGNRRNGRIQ